MSDPTRRDDEPNGDPKDLPVPESGDPGESAPVLPDGSDAPPRPKHPGMKMQRGPLLAVLALVVIAIVLVTAMITPLRNLYYRTLKPAAYVETLLLDTASELFREARTFGVTSAPFRTLGMLKGQRAAFTIDAALPEDIAGLALRYAGVFDPAMRELEITQTVDASPESPFGSDDPAESRFYLTEDTVYLFTEEGVLSFPAANFGEAYHAYIDRHEDAINGMFPYSDAAELWRTLATPDFDLSYSAFAHTKLPLEERGKSISDLLFDLLSLSEIRFPNETAYIPELQRSAAAIRVKISAPVLSEYLPKFADSALGEVPKFLKPRRLDEAELSTLYDVLSTVETDALFTLYEDAGRIVRVTLDLSGGRSYSLSILGEEDDFYFHRLRIDKETPGGGEATDITIDTRPDGGLSVRSEVFVNGQPAGSRELVWDPETAGPNVRYLKDGEEVYTDRLTGFYETDGAVCLESHPREGVEGELGFFLSAAHTDGSLERPVEARPGFDLPPEAFFQLTEPLQSFIAVLHYWPDFFR